MARGLIVTSSLVLFKNSSAISPWKRETVKIADRTPSPTANETHVTKRYCVAYGADEIHNRVAR